MVYYAYSHQRYNSDLVRRVNLHSFGSGMISKMFFLKILEIKYEYQIIGIKACILQGFWNIQFPIHEYHIKAYCAWDKYLKSCLTS